MDGQEFLDFVKGQARDWRSGDRVPASLEEWQAERQLLRERLITSWGGFPTEKCELNPQILGGFERDGYWVERLLLQSRPGILMTANAYVPKGTGPFPAVLCVHGHWKLAKSQPEIQARCIGLAKLGFFVLMVDAFGAGERGIGKDLGEYHGEMVASTLWPTGLTLAGLQVYDNMRAIDYIQSRSEVDGTRIGVTGASGGGNQTMYIGAMDDRLGCVVPVCSVGTYQAYLGAACCMCEVTPGAVSYTEEGAILGLVAPRALMLINATKDSFQFSVDEGAKSLAFAKQIYDLYGCPERATQAVFESGHGYNQEMRERMYGWMSLHLKGEGGSPIPEPAHQPEVVETLRCYPGNNRPDDFVTLPKFAHQEATRLTSRFSVPTHIQQWQAQEAGLCLGLQRLLGPFPAKTALEVATESSGTTQLIGLTSEPGVQLSAQRSGLQSPRRVLMLDLDLGRGALESPLAAALRDAGWDTAGVDLRGTASLAWKSDKIGRAPDHNTAEWSLWLGRPLIAQWVWDVLRVIEALDQSGPPATTTAVVGQGPAGLVALFAAALSTRIQRVVMNNTLASFITDQPYEGQRMGTLVPGILRDVGDIPHIAATLSPRRLIINHPQNAQGQPLDMQATESLFRTVSAAYSLEKSEQQLFLSMADPTVITNHLSREI